MAMNIRRVAGKTVHYSTRVAKKMLRNNPRFKRVVKRVVAAQMGITPAARFTTYDRWLQRNFPDYIELAKLHDQQQAFTYKPLISVIVPTYNTDPDFLRDCIDSVRGQVYDNWELCIVDDASPNAEVRTIIEEYAKKEPRIRYQSLKTNRHISDATNAAVRLASGEYISLFDHDDLLWPNALFEVVKALNEDHTLDFLYTDEDKISEDRFDHLGYFLKTDWNPDFLHSVNYITHFATIRKSLFDDLGGLRADFNGAQDWDLFLRVTDKTDKVRHIPKIVYSWRVHDLSTAKSTDSKPYVVAAQKAALEEDLARKGRSDAILERDKKHPGYWKVTYPVQGEPLISIVIPSKNQYKVVRRCIDSIYAKTTYKNFEIVLVDTGSDDPRVWRWYDQLERQHSNFRIVKWPEQPFSYSRSCNAGAAEAKGELLLMLNNDTEVLTSDWLQLLAGDAQRPEIGAVGCLLFFPDGRHIQHAGVGIGLGGYAANSFAMMTLDQPLSQTQHLMLNTRHNVTAVTAACLMIRKELYDQIGGFQEKYRVTYNDVDLCLRLHSLGYFNLYTPHVRLLHHESISVGSPTDDPKRDSKEFKKAMADFKKEWARYIDNDPNLNPNLSRDNAFYDI